MSSKTLPPSASASSSQLATTSDKGSVAWTACVDAAARFRTRSGSGAFHKSSFTIRSDQSSTWCGAASTMSSYQLAKRVLSTFDYVFVAESNRTALEFGDYVGFEQAMPHLSNSAYSTHHTAHGAAKAPPPVQHFMAEFYAQNQLDYELYLWALERHGLQAAYAPLVMDAVAFE